jgi:hypothetical protein
MTKKYATVFIISFILNLLWEKSHSLLYIHYKGSEITNLILLRAALFDACVITAAYIISRKSGFLKKNGWLVFASGVVYAIILEVWALKTGRWAYNEIMPVIPLIKSGLTPVVQLSLMGYISFKLSEKINLKNTKTK